MALKMKSLREAIESRRPKIALYGESGTGKTTQIMAIWALLGEDERMLIVTAEHGLRSLRQACPDMMDDPRVLVGEVGTIGDVKEAVAMASNPANAIAWCVVDSVSNIADRELRMRQERAPDGDARQAYGGMQSATLDILWKLVDVAAIGVLFIFQEVRNEVNEGSAKKPEPVNFYGPSVPSKGLQQAMPYVFDGVLRLEMKENGDRQIRTAKTRTIMAKDRTGRLDPFEPCDLGAIIAKILD
jgi:ABC-type dipeptide/oligopeptide/nickel transport system ATPase component